ncbi:helical backbone metal receptor [Mucilaginibacter phyllosphaerae]|uniref:ABC-type Fe3+-hydroxamate transport system substrate-binding protein n=1 Tax=Mucilaginibacter phyllosphaerae TaxID=1812349 RepID=A0A4Y8AHR9_9SPHI|nr:helical backbone metal receptor [Mucilaginibacter phyllosphaerae]MBB3971335.1 ABC-type Fe3+-hydroxamate transport system substrate-binding protein [Mucilaginibacter phyllosphaerae]TEW68610.1 cobalamin-binding protein [Mucilaginibacter phyllosphaerae]GGH24012.1 iron ABC transporter [Mucilaginibacter phyllosphaerae]
MPVFYDQMNNAVDLPQPPRRIISVVPSQTELLFTLGLDAHIAGITKFCIHPAKKVKHIAKIGGTKQLDMQAIHHLHPDLIIANKEENQQSQIEELMKHYPVWVSDIHNLPAALTMITKVGEITGRGAAAAKLYGSIGTQFKTLQPFVQPINVAYFIWRKPYMAAGKGTFIDSMLQLCGFKNVISDARYPEVTMDELKLLKPGVVLLSSEPYPFGQKHIDEFKNALPDSEIILVNGELFSWYGNRLLHSPAYFHQLIKKLTLK